MKSLPDIDIDVVDRNEVLADLVHVPASIIKNRTIKRHNTSVYFQDIPVDPVTGLASIDYQAAEDCGYMKIDFLNLGVYRNVRDNAHLDRLCNIEPVWEILQDRDIVNSLFHLDGNFDIVQKLQPKNIEELAIVLAIKIPCKRYLLNRSWTDIKKEIWLPVPDAAFIMKKSHAYAYAKVVMIQMNLLVENAS